MKKTIRILIIIACLMVLFCLPVFGLTEDEVKQQVDSAGASGVTGNIFIWFLCAIAFLKISQKIDSFMSSLGIHVGNTGGSMLAEAMIAMRGISIGKNFFSGGTGFRGHSSGGSANGTRFMQGGLAGVMSRNITNHAVKKANGTGNGGLGGRVYQSSLAKGGGFANRVIGNIANGSVGGTGTISGTDASDALLSYMGFTALGGADAPSFSDVEMGGGVIMATETNEENPNGIAMQMYSAEQFRKPEGDFKTVTMADGTQWYQQYAVPTVVQHPYTHPDGYVDRGETVEMRLPRAPQRKDKS